ncbi:MAG TPA: isocitrate lyase/phosphoenolpyruvate mutase family protein [Steroidobacteraceae bacterium]|nr:isocitrate lyase/phosphoenolpyruvate mutase family protein [Steroidobacteraceae bacterium]
MANQHELGAQFPALHAAPAAFVIPNVWDGASAAIMSGLGFKALATSSSACAATLGRLDGQISRAQALEHGRLIASLSPCPVAADLENGFGDSPAAVAETIGLAGATGLVGGSIEDAGSDPARPIYALNHAVERVAAAAEAARRLPFAFTLTARAENFLHDRPDLDDTIRRLQAFERAGADVLFAPGLPDLAAVRAVCGAVGKPVNFMIGMRGKSFGVADLAAAGVKRISLSTSLYRAAMTAVLAAAREVSGAGTFSYVDALVSGDQLGGYLRGLPAS